MTRVHVAEKRIWVDAESRALLHGEMHYWRLSPANWRDALRAVRGLGLDVLSTYVCWEYHELEPGRYDFRGETGARRNLVGFIELAATEGFWLLLRPGPYIYAEWANSGVPDRVVRYHRADPAFRAEAERYMTAAVEAIAPYQATRGGPVVLIQADNEPDPWADYYAAPLGLADTPGPFQAFLRERYVDVDALNAAWRTELRDFDDARAVLETRHADDVPRYLDVVRFYHAHTTDVIRWTADTYRRLGIDVPLYGNAYPGFDVQHWPAMEKAGAIDFVGPDLYPTAEFRGEHAEHRRMLELVRFTRSHSALPYIPEFEAGIWHGRHAQVGVLAANHYRLICLSALLAGVAGWGWYMLVNRDNWSMSPIDELGNPRPDLAAEFAAIVRVFREMDPPALEKLTQTAVTMDVLQIGARACGLPGEPMLEALYQADLDYECFDVETGRIAKPLLFYAGTDWLGRSGQERLRAYVEAGGTLVLCADIPLHDEYQQPLNVLELQPPSGVLHAAYPQRLEVAVALGDERLVCSSRTFGWYRDTPGEALVAQRIAEIPVTQQGMRIHSALPVGERYVVGYRERRGAGSVVCLGLEPSPELVLAVHRWLGVPIPSRASSAHVNTALFHRVDGADFLVAVNNGEDEHETAVALSTAYRSARDLFSGREWQVGDELHLKLPRKSGTVVRLD